MIRKMPRWVWAGGWGLAFLAGMVNVVGFLGFEHQAVTHLTGTTSMLGAAIAKLDGVTILHLLAMLFFFVLGTAVSGFVIQDSTLQLRRSYGVALFLESVLLFAAGWLLKGHNGAGYYLAACACGLQNAMATTYSGSVVRTTHLSGMFTDLGIFLGHALRGMRVDRLRLWLCLIIISAFLCGGIAGAFVFQRIGYDTLFIPATLTGVTALFYGFYRVPRSKKP